jgi:hypothetical protein
MEGTEKISGFEGSQIFFPVKSSVTQDFPHSIPILALIHRAKYALLL